LPSHTEREADMLEIFVRALRRHGPPDVLYLDNGATYIGEILQVACARLGISLLHARPYDAPARGKMECFWRTLREGCLDHLGSLTSLHDVEVRLYAFLDEHYHRAPHASLMGRAPGAVFGAGKRPPDDLDEQKLKDALTYGRRGGWTVRTPKLVERLAGSGRGWAAGGARRRGDPEPFGVHTRRAHPQPLGPA
jgi:hypothetical protein